MGIEAGSRIQRLPRRSTDPEPIFHSKIACHLPSRGRNVSKARKAAIGLSSLVHVKNGQSLVIPSQIAAHRQFEAFDVEIDFQFRCASFGYRFANGYDCR